MLVGLSLLPRFDTVGAATLNALGIAVFVAAVFVLVQRQRAGYRPPTWAWVVCFGAVSVDQIYLPIGPVLVLLVLLALCQGRPTGRIARILGRTRRTGKPQFST